MIACIKIVIPAAQNSSHAQQDGHCEEKKVTGWNRVTDKYHNAVCTQYCIYQK